ncbi:hypothetical protein RHECNPAF_294008 [Rhizobium etli CNPAF512]|nr:hypothetical protein RHECNPAF_294008 [Rhizobium etli CNPAF512]
MRIDRVFGQTKNDGDFRRGFAFARPFDDFRLALGQPSGHFVRQDFLVELVENPHGVEKHVGDLALVRLFTHAAQHQAISPPFRCEQRDEKEDAVAELVKQAIGGIGSRLSAPAMDRRCQKLGALCPDIPERLPQRRDEKADAALGDIGDDDITFTERSRRFGNAGKREIVEVIMLRRRFQQTEKIGAIDRPAQFRSGMKRSCRGITHSQPSSPPALPPIPKSWDIRLKGEELQKLRDG